LVYTCIVINFEVGSTHYNASSIIA
jgi:hypothetical protein